MKPKNKILLAGIDLDGTLLRNDKTISSFTAEAMINAARRGICLVPVTGRPLSGIPQCVLQLGVCDYAVTTNGAVITDLRTGECVYGAPITHSKTVLIMKELDEAGISYEAFADGFGYLSPAVMEKYKRKYESTPVGDYIKASRKVVQDPAAEFIKGGKCADEIFISCGSSARRTKIAERYETDSEIQLCFLDDTFLEITALGADKGTAFGYLRSMLGIKRENTIAFGDNTNDVSLVEAAGVFAAMENSCDEFKMQADIIAPSNEKDGVAKY